MALSSHLRRVRVGCHCGDSTTASALSNNGVKLHHQLGRRDPIQNWGARVDQILSCRGEGNLRTCGIIRPIQVAGAFPPTLHRCHSRPSWAITLHAGQFVDMNFDRCAVGPDLTFGEANSIPNLASSVNLFSVDPVSPTMMTRRATSIAANHLNIYLYDSDPHARQRKTTFWATDQITQRPDGIEMTHRNQKRWCGYSPAPAVARRHPADDCLQR